MGVPWYNGTAFQEKQWRLSAFIKRDHKSQHAPFLFSYILAGFWDMGEILGVSTDVALQASTYNHVRIGLTASAMEHFRPAMLKLNDGGRPQGCCAATFSACHGRGETSPTFPGGDAER